MGEEIINGSHNDNDNNDSDWTVYHSRRQKRHNKDERRFKRNQEKEINDDILNCEFEGVLGTTATIVGTTQANEALKMIIEIGKTLKNQILIIDLLNLNFRKVKFRKRSDKIK